MAYVKYSKKICEKICDLVREGCSVGEALRRLGKKAPTFQSWCKWKAENDDVNKMYLRAVQDKADTILDKINEIEKMLLNRDIDAGSANVLINTYKWKMAKFYPKMYGDASQVDITTNGKEIQVPKIVFKKE